MIEPIQDFSAKLAYSIPAFAAAVDVSPRFLYLEIKRGRLRLTKRGKKSLIVASDGIAWLRGDQAMAA
jgi:hypothetical protein